MTSKVFALLFVPLLCAVLPGCHSEAVQAAGLGDKAPLSASELKKVVLYERRYQEIGPPKGGNVPCKLSCLINNGTVLELSEVDAQFTLLRDKQVIYSTSVAFTHFPEEKGYSESLLPYAQRTGEMTLSLPEDKMEQADGYWFELESANCYRGEQDLHNFGHWLSFIETKTPAETEAKLNQDRSLASEVDPDSRLPVITFVPVEDNVDLFKAFLAKGAQADASGDGGYQAIHMAAIYSKSVLQYLLSIGQSVDTQTGDGYTPLMLAPQQGNRDTIDTLLQAGADVNHKAANGERPLGICAAHDPTGEITQELLDRHANPLYFANDRTSPLHNAAGNSKVQVIAVLVKAGVPVDYHTDHDRLTPLMTAAKTDQPEAVKELLKLGANPNFRTVNHHTAFDLAVHYECEKTAPLLKPVTKGPLNLDWSTEVRPELRSTNP